MQLATDKTVLGNFQNARFTHQGVTTRLFTRDGKFFVHTEGPDGQMADFPIHYTFGVEPLQQYLIPMPGGRLQSLTIAWDTQKQRWFHLYPNAQVHPGDPRHWTGLYQTWSVMCAECHSTNLQKQYDAQSKAYQTTWSAINVSCQACHGPGGRHVAWAKNKNTHADQPSPQKGLVVDFTTLAGREVREALQRAPDEGELYYTLGLLLAEEQRLDEAAEALGKAAGTPSSPRARGSRRRRHTAGRAARKCLFFFLSM